MKTENDTLQIEQDNYWMEIALEEAQQAYKENEIPIAAILVKNNQLITKNHNRTNQFKNPLAHAEKLVIEEIIQKGEKFLYDYTLYVTVEPCMMCAGLIVWSRVGRVVFGCYDKKAGAVGSVYNILKNRSFNHHPEIRNSIKSAECANIIKDFFQEKRSNK